MKPKLSSIDYRVLVFFDAAQQERIFAFRKLKDAKKFFASIKSGQLEKIVTYSYATR